MATPTAPGNLVPFLHLLNLRDMSEPRNSPATATTYPHMSNFTLYLLSDRSRTSQISCVQSRAVDVYHQRLPPHSKVVPPIARDAAGSCWVSIDLCRSHLATPLFPTRFPQVLLFLDPLWPPSSGVIYPLWITDKWFSLWAPVSWSTLSTTERAVESINERVFSSPLSPSFASEYL